MTAEILHGDCLEIMREMGEASIDAAITDPPYHLTSIVKRFGGDNAAPAKVGATGAYARASAGFMGKKWDGGDIAFRPDTWTEVYRVLKPGAHLVAFGGTRTFHRMACAVEDAGFEIRDTLMWVYGTGFPKSHNIGSGWGTALKPALEPIILARKPLSEHTIAANVLVHGTGALNIDGCRVGMAGEIVRTGRWPANLIHDGSDEVLDLFPDSAGQQGDVCGAESSRMGYNGGFRSTTAHPKRGDGGSAARFFYCAKASKADREEGNKHPTVKPTALMAWLCRLVTPPGGIVLDPFAGSGSTGKAALKEGFRFVGIEKESEYVAIIRARLDLPSGDAPRKHSMANSQEVK